MRRCCLEVGLHRRGRGGLAAGVIRCQRLTVVLQLTDFNGAVKLDRVGLAANAATCIKNNQLLRGGIIGHHKLVGGVNGTLKKDVVPFLTLWWAYSSSS